MAIIVRPITGTVRKPNGEVWPSAKVRVKLTSSIVADAALEAVYPVEAQTAVSDSLGVLPTGSTQLKVLAGYTYQLTLPDGNGGAFVAPAVEGDLSIDEVVALIAGGQSAATAGYTGVPVADAAYLTALIAEVPTATDVASATDVTAHTAATTSVHGVADTAALVDLTTAQTLTNKNLTDFSNDIDADDVHVEVRNESGGVLAVGTPVYASGYNVGLDIILVSKADATSAATMPTIAIVAEEIANNATGTGIVIGRIENANTSAFSVGDTLYVSEVAGELTATKPTGTALIQSVATVLRSHASSGVLQVSSSFSEDLPNLPANEMWYGDGSGVPVAGDAATIRGVIGLGTMATETATNYHPTSAFSAAPTAAEPLKADGAGGVGALLYKIGGTSIISGSAVALTIGSGGATFSVQIRTSVSSIRLVQDKFGVGVDSPSATVHAVAKTGATIGQIIQLAATPTANAIEIRSSDAAVLAAVTSTGTLALGQEATANHEISGKLKSSTTSNTQAARMAWAWVDSTHATRTTTTKFYNSDYGGEREAIATGANGTAATLGLLGATPIPRQSVAADASDLATAITLVNDLKAKLQSFGLFN